jgi:hypothetical protein
MSITYSYKIISVDAAARCMEIVYTAEGHQTMHIGARLPYEGETLEQIIRMYEPVRYWEEQQLSVVVPQVGRTGIIEPIVPSEPEPQEVSQSSQTIEQIPSTQV